MTIALSCRLLYDEALAVDSFGGDRLVANLPAGLHHWTPARVVGGQAERDVARGKRSKKKDKTPLNQTLLRRSWPFTPGLDTIDHLLEGVAKNGSICPHDICGFEKAAAAVVRRTLGLKRELVMSVGLCGLLAANLPILLL